MSLPSGQPATLQGVAAALKLLRLMAKHPTMGVRESARHLDITPTAAQRLLRTLDAEGFLTRSERDKAYALSPLVVEIASAYIERHDFASLARQSMVALHEFSQETVALYTAYDGMRLCLTEIASPHPLRMVAQTGSVRTITNGATDKVFRAFSSPADVARMDERLVERGEKYVPGTPTREELEEIRAAGWADSYGARVAGSAAVSAAVTTSEGLYVLCLFGPQERMQQLGMEEVRRRVCRTAQELAAVLPWVGGPIIRRETS